MNRRLALAVLALILVLTGALFLARTGWPALESAPAPAAETQAGAPEPAPAAPADAPAVTNGKIIVCPGNPRCPKGGRGN